MSFARPLDLEAQKPMVMPSASGAAAAPVAPGFLAQAQVFVLVKEFVIEFLTRLDSIASYVCLPSEHPESRSCFLSSRLQGRHRLFLSLRLIVQFELCHSVCAGRLPERGTQIFAPFFDSLISF
jgi:hypothetical protein